MNTDSANGLMVLTTTHRARSLLPSRGDARYERILAKILRRSVKYFETKKVDNQSMAATNGMSPQKLSQTGSCLCGTVKFRIDGEIRFNHFCHCRACGRARAMTPVHLIGVNGNFTILEGEKEVKVIDGMRSMSHAICSKCGVGLYQGPKGRDYFATFPSTFQIERESELEECRSRGVPSSVLPPYLQPTAHCHYENRLMNFQDDLPKYQTNKAAGTIMTNDGKIIGN